MPLATQPMWSGLPNPLSGFLSFSGNAVSIGTWNTRGLLCSNRKHRHQKLGALKTILGHTSILCLQETHGSCADIDLFMSDLKSRFLIFHSPFLDPTFLGGVDPMLDSENRFDFDPAGNRVVKATGGVITLVNTDSARIEDCNFEPIIHGRASRLSICSWGKVSVTFNIHNEQLTPAQFAIFGKTYFGWSQICC